MHWWTIAALVLSAGAADPAPAGEDLTALMDKARQVQVADVAAWRAYRFKRSALREEVDDDGRIVVREDLLFDIRPSGEGFEEKLVKKDGRAPTGEEISYYGRKRPFAKHYSTLVTGTGEGEEGGFSLGHLLRMTAYRYAGREVVEGTPCYRVDFSPDEDRQADGIAGKLTKAMEGSLWITVDGLHLARAEAQTVGAVSLALSLAKVHQLEVSMVSAPVSAGVWLPKRIDVKARARILFSSRWRTNRFRYLDFQPVKAPSSMPASP